MIGHERCTAQNADTFTYGMYGQDFKENNVHYAALLSHLTLIHGSLCCTSYYYTLANSDVDSNPYLSRPALLYVSLRSNCGKWLLFLYSPSRDH